jgi:4-amino-4-deoxy-L-arabinose transferase-like glycosyltransferase
MLRRSHLVIIVILVAAALARLAFTSLLVGWDTDARGDEIDYHKIAVSVADGEGFAVDGRPTGRRPPVFPFVLSVFYKVFGAHPSLGRAIQILLGVLVVFLVYLVARRHFDKTVGWVAAAIAAVNPFLTLISGYLLTENLYMVLVLLTLLLLPTPRHLNESLRRILPAAAVMAVATLTRPTGLPLGICILCAGLAFGAGSLVRRWGNGVIAAVLFCLLLLPWCIRNYQLVGGWVGLTTHGGITFYQGNNQKVVDIPHYRGGVTPLAGLPHASEMAGMGELDQNQFAWAKGKEFLGRNKPLVPRIMWWKFARFWRLRSDAGLSGVKSGWWWSKDSFLGRLASNFDVGFVYAVVVFPLFLAGVVLTRFRWRELLYLYGVVVAHTAVALIFFGSIRGRIPVEPVIAVFAAVTVVRLYHRFRPSP